MKQQGEKLADARAALKFEMGVSEGLSDDVMRLRAALKLSRVALRGVLRWEGDCDDAETRDRDRARKALKAIDEVLA